MAESNSQPPWASRSPEDRLALHEALLRALSDGGVGVVLADALEQRLVYVNPAAAAIGGYTPDELVRVPSFFALVAPEERPRLQARLQANLENWKPSDSGETIAIRKDGGRVPVEYHAEMVQVGEQTLVMTFLRDLSGVKLAEQARLDLTRQAGEIDAMRRLDKQRQRLLRKVAQDIRTPLTPVKVELHVLRERGAAAFPEEDRRRLDVMGRNLDALQRRLDAYLKRTDGEGEGSESEVAAWEKAANKDST